MRANLALASWLGLSLALAMGAGMVVAAEPGAAAVPAATPAVDPGKAQHIMQLLQLSGAANVGADASTAVIKSLQTSFPKVPQEFWDNVAKEIKTDDLVAQIVAVYDKHFSDAELQQIIAFYQSPVGKKMNDATTKIQEESYAAGKEWGTQAAQKIVARLQEKGYIEKN